MAQQYSVDIVAKVLGGKAVEKLEEALKGADKAADQLAGSLPKTAKGVKAVGASSKKAATNVQKLSSGFGALKVAIGALAVGLIVKQFIDLSNAIISSAGELQKLEAAFTSLTGSADAAAELRNQLFQLSKTTPFPNKSLETAARRFLAVGIEVENIEGTINRVGSLAAQSGQDLNRLGLIYAQVYAKGRLTGEENLQFLEAGIDLTDDLGKVTGKTGKALLDAMSKGQISVGDVNDAIKLATGEMTVLDQASRAVDVQLSNIGDNVGQVALGFSSALAPAFAAVFDIINKAFDLLFPSLESVLELFKPLLAESERFAELLEGNPALVDAIAQVFESLILFGISPAVKGLEDMNEELEQNPQGLINLIYDIELAIRASLLTAKALVQTLAAVGKLTAGISTAKLKPGKGFGLILDAVKEAGNVGNTLGALGGLERLQQQPLKPRPPKKPRSGSLQDRPDASNDGGKSGGSSGSSGRSAAAAARKAEREAERLQKQLEKQFAASEKLKVNADNRLLVAKAINEQDRIQLEGMVKKDEIERKYTELLSNQLSDAEEANLLAAKGLETDLAVLETNEALKDLRAGAVEGLTAENALLTAKLNGTEEEYILRKKIADLVKAGGGSVSEAEASGLVTQNAALKERAEELEKNKAAVEQLAGSISGELTDAFRSIVDGSKSAEEALSDAFKGIADSFLDMAMKMIQEWVKMQIIGLVGSLLGGPAGSPTPTGTNFFEGRAPGLATGGTANGGQPYIVGEKGPELFIPGVTGTVSNADQFEAARDALSDGSTGDAFDENGEALSSSSSTISNQGGNSSSSSSSIFGGSTSNYYSQNGSALAAISRSFAENNNTLSSTSSIMRDRSMERESENTTSSAGTMTIETQVINNVEYATVDQVAKSSALAAKQARAQVFSDMKNKPSRRAAVGLR